MFGILLLPMRLPLIQLDCYNLGQCYLYHSLYHNLKLIKNNKLPNSTSMIRKSIGWFTLTFIVGLLQIWVTLIVGYLKGTPVLEDLIWDGVIPFFSIVLTSSLVIDHNLFGKTPMVIESGPFANPSDFVNGLMFSFIPWIVIIIPCLAIYVTCYVAKPGEIIPVVIMEVLLLVFTACYAIFIKFFHFREEERSQQEKQKMVAELRKQKEQEEKPKQAQGKKSKPMSTQQLQLKGLQ